MNVTELFGVELAGHLDRCLARARRIGSTVAVLGCTTAEADPETMATLTSVLTGSVRGSDLVATRLDGSQVLLVLDDLESADEALAVATRLRHSASSELAAAHGSLTCAYALATNDDRDLTSATLIEHLLDTLAGATHHGSGSLEVYEDQRRSSYEKRPDREAELRHALVNEEITARYQPIIDLGTKQLVGVEALARWTSPTYGVVRPADFLPVARGCGLMHELGEQMLIQAVTELARWQRARPGQPFSMHVNLSGHELRERNLAAVISYLCKAAGADPTGLVVDVEESTIMSQTDHVLPSLEAIRALGARVSIDDFGTGQSSIAALHRLPVDLVKIHGSFVAGVAAPVNEAGIVHAVVQLASALGLGVIAESVETVEQAEALVALGCPLAQGFLFGPAMRIERVENLAATLAEQAASARLAG
ncbi:MAG: EAL domain-containing protein [Acidimicrobiia bacterium]